MQQTFLKVLFSVSSSWTHQAKHTLHDRDGGAHKAATTPAVYLKPAEKGLDLAREKVQFSLKVGCYPIHVPLANPILYRTC